MPDLRQEIATLARKSHGRLLAYLSSESRDVAGAEDAVSEAWAAALDSWARDGIPDRPEAWLLSVARHRLIDQARRRRVRNEHLERQSQLHEGSVEPQDLDEGFPDRRVELLFVCAHPAIDATMHTPLMLQTVLGLSAERIAQAFLVRPTVMGQRLVRAKTKIRDAAIPFHVPDGAELPNRLNAVLSAIYAAFGLGHDETVGADSRGQDLAQDAIWLARVIRERMPGVPEVRGLLALMLFNDARRSSRRGQDGSYVPLSVQDPASWSRALIDEAEQELAAAASFKEIGRFQLEAAIQSVHCDRARSGRTDWDAIVLFYEQLLLITPTLGARVAHAAALSELRGAREALLILDTFCGDELQTYQPYWAARAHFLLLLGRMGEAREATERAIGLTEDPSLRRFLLARLPQKF